MKRVSGLATFAFALLAMFFLDNLAAAPAAPQPTKPNFARLKTISPFEIDLTWRDRSGNADGYLIERSTNRIHFRQIAQVLPGTTTYRDKNLFPGTQYFYRLRSFHGSRTSRYDTASARTQTLPVQLSVVEWGSFNSFVVPANTHLVSVSAGAFHTLGLKKDGTVIAWGDVATTVPTNLNNVIAISAGASFGLALKSDGTVVEWGNSGIGLPRVLGPPIEFPPPIIVIQSTNIFPQPPILPPILPIPIRPILPVQPVQPILPPVIQPIQLNPQAQPLSSPRLTAPSPLSPPDGLTNVVAISAGFGHCLALKSDGTVVAWGADDLGETEVPPGLNGVVEIAAGQAHSLALKSDGTVVQWGTVLPVPTNLDSVIGIAAGAGLSAALKSDGTIVSWGSTDDYTTAATSNLMQVAAIALGEAQGVALKQNGSLFAWGLGFSPGDPPVLGNSVVAIGAQWFHHVTLSTAPAAPSDPYATVLSPTRIQFTWKDNSRDEKVFAVERQQITELGAWTQIATVAANKTNYVDSTVTTNNSYAYRVRALGKFGTSPYCPQVTVIVAPLEAPVSLLATWPSTNGVALFWNDVFGGIDGYKIERAPDDNGVPGAWQEIASGTVSNPFVDATAQPNNTYWYRVRSFNVVGFSPYSNQILVGVFSPLVPVGLGSTTYGSNITIFWSANPNSLTPTGYKVESAPDVDNAPGPWTEVTNVSANVNTYTDFGRSVGVSEWYRIRAYNWIGDSPYTDPIQVTLPPTPTPYDLSGSIGLTQSINLHWDSLQVDGFDVERAPDVNGSPGAWAQIASMDNAQAFQGSFSDTNVVANTTYWYRVRGFSAVGNSDYSTPLQITASLPDAPSDLIVFMADRVQIYWSYDPSALFSFSIERAADANGSPGAWQEIGTLTNTSPFSNFSFTDNNALPNTIYWYRVRAHNWIGYSDYSQPASIGTFPPATPSDFAVQSYRNSAQLSWDGPFGESGGFVIERAPDRNGAPGLWTFLASISPSDRSYTDINVTANTTYWYGVSAYNWAGSSPFTAPLSATIGPPNPPTDLVVQIGLATNTVGLSWVDNSRDADVFNIEYAPDTNGVPGPWTEIATLPGTNEQYLSFTDTNALGFTTNWYRVRAVNGLGTSDYAAPARIALLPPHVPTDFVGNSSGPNEIDLFWLDLDDLVQGYLLERAPDVAGVPGAWSEVFNGLAGQNIFLPDATVASGTTYWYRIRAFNWVGDSALTASISIATPPIVIVPHASPQIVSLTPTNGGMLIQWSTAAGNTDVVQVCGDFMSGYSNISPALVISGAGTTSTNYFDAGALTNSPARFYRIQSSR